MKLHSCKLACAAAFASALFYGLCAAVMYWMPEKALHYKAAAMHLRNLDILAPYVQITWKSFFMGLAQVVISSFVYVYILAWVYNWTTCCAHSGACSCACDQEKSCMCTCSHNGACSDTCGCKCGHNGPCKGH